MTRRFRTLLIVLIVAGLVLALDRLSKNWVLANLELFDSWTPFAAFPYFRIVHTQNTGVAFGLFRNGGILFSFVAAIAIIGILIYSLRLENNSRLMPICLGLLMGGAAGNNLWDRLQYGHVIDFIDFRYSERWHFYTFNVADTAIVCGVAVLLILVYLEDRQRLVAGQTGPQQSS